MGVEEGGHGAHAPAPESDGGDRGKGSEILDGGLHVVLFVGAQGDVIAVGEARAGKVEGKDGHVVLEGIEEDFLCVSL